VNNVPLLLQQAEAAARQGQDNVARRLFKAALHHDPTNDQALLWLVYLAEDGQASLTCLAQFLDAHPHHPEARAAIRWARQRVPTSKPQQTLLPQQKATSVSHRSPRLFWGLALLVLLIGMGITWQVGRTPTASGQANSPTTAPRLAAPTRNAPPITAEPPAPLRFLMEVVRAAITLPTPTPTPSPTATPHSAWAPVLGEPQSRNLSCESRSAADLAAHWGVMVDELEFLNALGRSDNPHKGFVGDVDSPPGSLPPDGYGVYAEPVAATLRDYGLDAHPVYNLGPDGLRAELLTGRPVLVWATYGMQPQEPVEWVSSDGQVSTVLAFMHTFIVTGFDQEGFFILDAYDATMQYYPDNTFLTVWNSFDQMAVTVAGPLSAADSAGNE